MQLLRLIRCEARRLLRNPAFFVLLIWGIGLLKMSVIQICMGLMEHLI